MKLLFSYLKPYKWLILLALLLGAISQVFSMLDPHFIGVIIDKFAIHPHHSGYYNEKQEFIAEQSRTRSDFIFGILGYFSLIIIVTIIARIAKALQDSIVNITVQRFGTRLFTDGLKHTLQLSYHEFETQRSGETISILQKVKTDTERLISSFIYILFAAVVATIFVTVYSFSIHWAIVPIYFGGILFIAFLSKILSKKIKIVQQKIVSQVSSLAGTATESLRNIELIKTLGLTKQQMNQVDTNSTNILNLEIKKVKKIRVLFFILGASISLFRQLLMFVLLWLIFEDKLTAGKLITLSYYSFFIFNPLYDIGNIVLYFREAQASLNKLQEILNKAPERKPKKAVHINSINEIAFRNVSFKYQTSLFYPLENISFETRKGQAIAFVGPTGSGKTTLVKLLTGLYSPEKGEILYNGVNGNEIDFDALRGQIGFVSQDDQLFAGTLKENLLFVNPAATDKDIIEALEKAACHNLLARSNKGIDTMIGEGGIKISGGEKQRLSIARALIRDPKLLIFDEATSSLDSITEQEVTSTIRSLSSLNKQITILISHRLSTIMHADTIYVLEKGSIVETGTHDSLLAEKGLYYAMWRQQIGERRGEEYRTDDHGMMNGEVSSENGTIVVPTDINLNKS